jgi:SAM-dependent methyltransferase
VTNEEPATSNAFSTDAWRTDASARWLAHADRMEMMLEPVLDPLFEHAALRRGETVLDVGCGAGATTFRAATAVPGGTVVAVDVSAELVEAASSAARSRATSDAAPIEWIVADAQRADLGDRRFDAVISRFGVMFFDDPVEAFANLRRSTRAGGRLAVATWRPRDQSDFQSVGFNALNDALISAGNDVTVPDPAAGPYSFGIDDHIHAVLGSAGWTDVVVHPIELDLYFAGPGITPAQAADVAVTMGGMATFLEPYGDDGLSIARQALVEAYTPFHDGVGVRLGAAMTVITATA